LKIPSGTTVPVFHQRAPVNPSSSQRRRRNSVRRFASTVGAWPESTSPREKLPWRSILLPLTSSVRSAFPSSIDGLLACPAILRNRLLLEISVRLRLEPPRSCPRGRSRLFRASNPVAAGSLEVPRAALVLRFIGLARALITVRRSGSNTPRVAPSGVVARPLTLVSPRECSNEPVGAFASDSPASISDVRGLESGFRFAYRSEFPHLLQKSVAFDSPLRLHLGTP
jgi:hypothetical protein